jgi:hypothetical protein
MILREGGEVEAFLDDFELGKARIQELVGGLAGVQGIDPKHILFKWSMLEGMVLPEHGLQLNDKVYTLKIYLGKKSQPLTFAAHSVHASIRNPKAFLSAYEGYVITALRKLKRLSVAAAGKSW